MADLALLLPILVPLATACLCAMAWTRPAVQRQVALAGAAALFGSSLWLFAEVRGAGVLATQLGNWQAPFGITFVADLFSAIMVVVSGTLGLAVLLFAREDVSKAEEHAGFHPLAQGLLAGVNGAFLTGDIFNLYVWFEVMLVTSFGLLTLGRTREQLDAGVKYVSLNLVGTMLFLLGIGILYGATGTLNMADLAVRLPDLAGQPAVTGAALLFLVAFGVKAAMFPLFAWLPASYHTAGISVAAIFAGLLTKVGVYALVRVFTLMFQAGDTNLQAILGVVAVLTMVTGVLGAAIQWDVRRILSFHIISQIGYMLLGLAIYTPLAVAGAVFYVVHHIIVKANLFLLAGVIKRRGGSFDLRRSGGLMRQAPWLAVLFLVPAMSLAGIPPLSGFWAKFLVIDASLDAGHGLMAAAALAVGALTLYSMTKIWTEAFWKAPPAPAVPAPRGAARVGAATVAPIAALAAVTVAIGLNAEPLVAFSNAAAAQLLSPTAYVETVLGGTP